MARNPYKALLDLMPSPRLLVGEVIAYADGVADIELADGSVMQARGEVVVSDQVFFRNGLIEGPAPTLTDESIEV